MGTRMMGLAPRPPFFSGQMWLGAHFWALSVFLKKFIMFYCAGHLWLGARLLGSLVYFFALWFLFSFLFSFFSMSASWIPPLRYENILHLLYRILILAGLEFRIPRSPHSEALLKNTPSGVNVCVEMIPSFKERGDYFCKGVPLACPPSQV